MSQPPVILFDGVCNLCNAAVQWILKRDTQAVFRFASLQSNAARRLLASAPALPDSVILIDEQGSIHTQSDAALAIARRLGFPWSLAVLFAPVPRVIRNAAYAFIARHRYRWFGRRDACLLPTPDIAARFLD